MFPQLQRACAKNTSYFAALEEAFQVTVIYIHRYIWLE